MRRAGKAPVAAQVRSRLCMVSPGTRQKGKARRTEPVPAGAARRPRLPASFTARCWLVNSAAATSGTSATEGILPLRSTATERPQRCGSRVTSSSLVAVARTGFVFKFSV